MRRVMIAMMATAMVSGCDGEPMDAPSLALYEVTALEALLDVEVSIDVRVDGCASGVASLRIFRGEQIVLAADGGANGIVPTRVTLPVTELTAPGGWPTPITLDGAVTCGDGAEARSAPITVQVVPARARIGPNDAIWPGYLFWPRPDGTVLFCDGRTVVRVDADGAHLAESGDIGCQLDTTMHVRADRLVFVSGDEIAVLDRRTLAVLYAVRADAVAVGQHRLALLRDNGSVPEESLELEVLVIDERRSLGRWVLGGPGLDFPMTAPHIDPHTGLVSLLTVRVHLEPLAGEVLRWQIDPMQAEVPGATSVGPIESTGGSLVIGSPGGWLLEPGHALLVHTHPVTGATRLSLRAFEGGDDVWSIDLDGPPRAVAMGGHGLLLYAGPELIRVDADGALIARWRAEDGYAVSQPVAHRDGGVIASLRADDGEAHRIVFLDARLEPAWQMPYRFAFGAAFDEDGAPWIVIPTLLRLHPATTYIERAR